MRVTSVRVFPTVAANGRLRAFAAVTFDDCFVVHDLKVVEIERGLFVQMPSRKDRRGDYRDIAHPTNTQFRATLEETILDEYRRIAAAETATKEADSVDLPTTA